MYQYDNSKAKTQKTNKLEIAPKEYRSKYNNKILYDFSLLNSNITDSEVITDIKTQAFKHCHNTNYELAIFKTCDIFSSFNYYSGYIWFKLYRIYNNRGECLYTIMRLAKIDISFGERKNIYDNFTTTDIISEKCEQNNYPKDIEIA